uniref:E3 SUMO-protein ligase NSE2 n=1 Tax=Castor canadensis TaxID=51338 RepID=A0A8C0ZWF3_CASCN
MCCCKNNPTWGDGIKWVIPKGNGWWICSPSRLTPCLSTNVFNSSKEFCVLVAVLPRILCHSEESLYSYWNTGTGERKKREPISALTIATLLSLGVAGAGTGIASLATQHKGMSSLRGHRRGYREDRKERPENIPDLKLLVEKQFLTLQNKNSDADFQNNEKFVQFKQQLKELKKQYGLQVDKEADGLGIDEDMIVTQSQTNFICPITQLEMKKPVKNKVCGHTYEEEAIVRMIESKHKRKKKACCPKIGCSHTDMRMSDLVQDEALRRAIESHNKKRYRQTM